MTKLNEGKKRSSFALRTRVAEMPTKGILKGALRALLTELALAQGANSKGWVGNAALRQTLGVNKNTIDRNIQVLVLLGLIERESAPGDKVFTSIREDEVDAWIASPGIAIDPATLDTIRRLRSGYKSPVFGDEIFGLLYETEDGVLMNSKRDVEYDDYAQNFAMNLFFDLGQPECFQPCERKWREQFAALIGKKHSPEEIEDCLWEFLPHTLAGPEILPATAWAKKDDPAVVNYLIKHHGHLATWNVELRNSPEPMDFIAAHLNQMMEQWLNYCRVINDKEDAEFFDVIAREKAAGVDSGIGCPSSGVGRRQNLQQWLETQQKIQRNGEESERWVREWEAEREAEEKCQREKCADWERDYRKRHPVAGHFAPVDIENRGPSRA
jgi:hypothetical protein